MKNMIPFFCLQFFCRSCLLTTLLLAALAPLQPKPITATELANEVAW